MNMSVDLKSKTKNIKKEHNMTIVNNLLVAIVIIAFFLSILIFYYLMLYRETRESVTKNCELNAVKAANEIEEYLATGTDVILMTSFSLNDMMKNGYTNKTIQDYMVSQNYAASKVVPDQVNGIYGYIRKEFLNGIGWIPYQDYDPTNRPWYKNALSDPDEVAIVNPYHDARTGKVMITMSKALNDKKSVVALDLSVDVLQSITEKIAEAGKTDIEIVLDSNYRVIAHSDEAEVGKYYSVKTSSIGSAIVTEMNKKSSENNHFMMQYHNQRYIVYTVKINNNWICLSVTNITSVLHRLAMPLILTIFVSILVVAILLFIMIGSFRKEALAAKMSKIAAEQSEMAHVDQMTGLKNRRAYSEMLERYSETVPEGCKVVVFDLNGLKEMNDTRGHEAGDELIRAAAECIRTSFSGVDDIFRIGGDEFCLVTTMSSSQVAECLKKLDQVSSSWTGSHVNGVSISSGIGTDREHAHIENIFREADKNMYKQKQDYYNTTDHDRRRRPR